MEEFIINWNDIIFKGIIILVNALIGTFLIPWLVQLKKKSKANQVTKFFKTMVSSAEQLFGGKSGKVKHDFVLREAFKKYKDQYDEETIDMYIQGAVKELKEEDKEYKDQTIHQKEKYTKYKANEFKDFGDKNYQERESKVTKEDIIPKKRTIR